VREQVFNKSIKENLIIEPSAGPPLITMFRLLWQHQTGFACHGRFSVTAYLLGVMPNPLSGVFPFDTRTENRRHCTSDYRC
jgi:hypothetical protein